MRHAALVALLAGAAFLPVLAGPPRKAAKPTPAKAPADLPAAGAGGELLDLATGRSRAIGAMLESRTDFQATAFPDGRVLVTGGSVKGGTSEWFDPATRRFTPGPSLTQARQGHRAALLKNGRLVLLGGTESPAAAEVLEPGAAKFQPLPGGARFGLSAEAVELEEGLLMIDGQEGKCWLWNGEPKGPKSTGALNTARILFRALRLQDGRVLVTGGWPAPPSTEPRRGFRRPAPATPASAQLPVEVFTPRRGRWSAWKALAQPRAQHAMTRLGDGRVALLGGFGASADAAAGTLELLDPSKESVERLGTTPHLGMAPGLAEGGLLLAERSTAPVKIEAPTHVLRPGAAPWKLANAYLAPQLLPLRDGQLLVLGSPVWGPGLERWDPRTRQCQYLGALRAGTESLALLEGKVVALGALVDAIDAKTGQLTPLGRAEELAAQLKKAKPYAGSARLGAPPFPNGETVKDALVVNLDAQKALVLGGATDEAPEGTDRVWVWDLKKKSLAPSGPMKAKRRFADAPKAGEGALKLPDGTVLIWSAQ